MPMMRALMRLTVEPASSEVEAGEEVAEQPEESLPISGASAEDDYPVTH